MGATDPKGQAVEATFYHPDDNLANTIVKAWREKSFKDTLLTYPDLHNKESWERRDQPDYERVSKALAEMQVSQKFPVVLTQAQYDWGYRMTRDHEVIFVLPDQPAAFAGGAAFDIAQEAMRRVVFGM